MWALFLLGWYAGLSDWQTEAGDNETNATVGLFTGPNVAVA